MFLTTCVGYFGSIKLIELDLLTYICSVWPKDVKYKKWRKKIGLFSNWDND